MDLSLIMLLFFFSSLALVHDLAESIVGDITPYCGVSKEEKRLREMNAMQEITKLIAPRGERLMELFEVNAHFNLLEFRVSTLQSNINCADINDKDTVI